MFYNERKNIMIKQWLNKKQERFYIWFAYHLPKKLVRWCFVRVGTYASFVDNDKVIGEITIMRALDIWERI